MVHDHRHWVTSKSMCMTLSPITALNIACRFLLLHHLKDILVGELFDSNDLEAGIFRNVEIYIEPMS